VDILQILFLIVEIEGSLIDTHISNYLSELDVNRNKIYLIIQVSNTDIVSSKTENTKHRYSKNIHIRPELSLLQNRMTI